MTQLGEYKLGESKLGEPVTLASIDAPTGLSVSNVTKTSADLSWTDNSSAETGYEPQRAKWYPDISQWGPWRPLDVLDPDTESYTDDTPQPGTKYRWRVRVFNSDLEAFSNVVEDTTTSSGARQTNVATTGWYVEIDNPNANSPITPTVLEGARRLPTVNDLPRVEIPVPYDENWHTDAWNQATMRVWYDGEKLPIEELDHRRVETRQGQKRTMLEGVGGIELRNEIEREVTFEEAHVVAKDIADQASSYTLNFDDPAATIDENVLMAEADDQLSWEALLGSIPDETAAQLDGSGTLEPTKTLRFAEGEDVLGNAATTSDSRHSAGSAARYLTPNNNSSESFTFDHALPPDTLRGGVLADKNDSRPNPKFTVTVNGESTSVSLGGFGLSDQNRGWVETINTANSSQLAAGASATVSFEFPSGGAPGTDTYSDNYDYFSENFNITSSDTGNAQDLIHPLDEVDEETYVTDSGGNEQIEGTDYTVDYSNDTITFSNTGDYTVEYTVDVCPIDVDAVAVWDTRHHSVGDFPEDPDASGFLPGPSLHSPDGVEVETSDITTPWSVVGGKIAITVDRTDGALALAVSNDSGVSWSGTASNPTSTSADFASGSPQVRGRITVGETGETRTTQAPTEGFAGHKVDTADLFADLDETPTLANRSFDGQAIDAHRQIADERNFVFEIRAVDDDTISVEWAQPGQRTSTVDPDVVAFESDRQTEDLIEQITIKGASQWRRGEEVNLPHGTATDLKHDYIVNSSESVIDASGGSNDGDQFDRGSDYEMQYLTGKIEALSSGTIPDGGAVSIDYKHTVSGTYPDPGEVTDPRSDTKTVKGLTSDRVCEQTAIFIVDRSNTPIWEATMTVARGEVGFNVIDEINPPDLPTQNTALQVRSIEVSDQSISIRLASRRTTGEIIQDLNQRMSTLEGRT